MHSRSSSNETNEKKMCIQIFFVQKIGKNPVQNQKNAGEKTIKINKNIIFFIEFMVESSNIIFCAVCVCTS